jgi:hypothetical protein
MAGTNSERDKSHHFLRKNRRVCYVLLLVGFDGRRQLAAERREDLSKSAGLKHVAQVEDGGIFFI